MAEYKGIKGFKVQSVASDPTPASIGRIWYNTTSGALKFDGVGTGAWASSDNVPTGRQRSMGFGSTTAALFITGQEQPGIPDGSMVASTLSYNGSAWPDTSKDVNTVRRGGAGFGASSTSGLIAGGVGPPPATAFTEVYNGSTWTEVNNLDEGVSGCASGGTATAGLCVSGEGNPGGNQDWDGTNWTEAADMNSGRTELFGSSHGTPSAFLVSSGGPASSESILCESWNGSAWTEVGDVNFGSSLGGGAGTSTACLKYGGVYSSPPVTYKVTNNSETWDGTSWTTAGTLGTARQMQATQGAGTSTAALSMSGSNKPANHSVLANVEEWDGAPAAVKTETVT